MRPIDSIIIHCSATPEGKHFTAADIRRWHKAQGWSDIGYHYVILLDGTVQEGRPISQPGAHCKGMNARSIGICYIGGLAADGKTPKDTRTTAQILELLGTINRDLGVTMVMITHSLSVASRVCNRIAVISRGKIVELGDTEDVFTNPQSEAAKAIIAHHAGQETESEKGEVI